MAGRGGGRPLVAATAVAAAARGSGDCRFTSAVAVATIASDAVTFLIFLAPRRTADRSGGGAVASTALRLACGGGGSGGGACGGQP